MMDVPNAFETLPWILWLVLLPLIGALFTFLFPRRAVLLGIITASGVLFAASSLLFQITNGGAQRYPEVFGQEILFHPHD